MQLNPVFRLTRPTTRIGTEPASSASCATSRRCGATWSRSGGQAEASAVLTAITLLDEARS